MAFPENRLSSLPVPHAFIGGRALPVTPLTDYETGGKAFNDTSEGLMYQVWRCRIVEEEEIIVDAENVAEQVIHTGSAITECSLSFDQNMRPALAYVEGGESFFRWFDPQADQQVVLPLGAGVVTPRVALDDKRPNQIGYSDVVLAYLRDENLYFRLQRDRYATEYLLREAVPAPGLIKIGMAANLRFQFMLRIPR